MLGYVLSRNLDSEVIVTLLNSHTHVENGV